MDATLFKFSLPSDFVDKLLDRVEKLNIERQKSEKKSSQKLNLFGSNQKTGLLAGSDKIFDDRKPISSGLSHNVVSKLVETAFWASIKKEEGRETLFSILYRCADNTQDFFNSMGIIDKNEFLFEEPKILSSDQIAKLAPAIPDNFAILVSADEKETLFINGFVPLTSGELKLSVIDPGTLTISYQNDNLALISGDKVSFIRYSSFGVNTGSIWGKIFAEKGKKYTVFSDPRVTILKHSLIRMRKMRHGGAIIIVPRYAQKIGSIEKIGTVSSPLYGYGNALIEGIPERNRYSYLYDDPNLREFGNRIAKLSCVDGSVVLTKDLDIIGFGAKLNGLKSPDVIYRMTPYDEPRPFSKINLDALGNLRHRSAAKYIVSQPKSVAIVVSQDGNISGFYCEPDKGNRTTLHVRSHLEYVLL